MPLQDEGCGSPRSHRRPARRTGRRCSATRRGRTGRAPPCSGSWHRSRRAGACPTPLCRCSAARSCGECYALPGPPRPCVRCYARGSCRTRRACTSWATAASPTSSPTAAGGGATPAWSSATARRCSSTRCSTCGSPGRDARRDGAAHGAPRRSPRRQHPRQRRPLLRQPARRAGPRSSPRRRRPTRWARCRRRCSPALSERRGRGRRAVPRGSSAPFDFDGIDAHAADPHLRRPPRPRGRRPRRRADRGRAGAHREATRSSTCPADRTVFTGDILFIGGTPIVWAGPLSNWVAACDLILGLDVEAVVPGPRSGHRQGRRRPGARLPGLRRRRGDGAPRGRHGRLEAARDIALGAVPVTGASAGASPSTSTPCTATLDPTYRAPDVVELFRRMADLER